MSQTINTNLVALNAQRAQTKSASDLAGALARLSSGLRINGASDDAAGLAIADRFAAQIKGTAQAGRNANDAISMAQTAEGGLAAIGDNLQRMRELSVQAANATLSAGDRAAVQLEVVQLRAEIDRVATQTQFNGTSLLDGSFAAKAFQVGADRGQTINSPPLASARSDALGAYQGFSMLFGVPSPSNTPVPLTVTLPGGNPISLGSVALDARDIAAAFNGSGIAGLSATLVTSGWSFFNSQANATASGTATYTLNGVAIDIAGTAGAAAIGANRSAAVSAINAKSAVTGVVATDTSANISLRAADGRNISMAYSAGSFTGSSELDFGLPSLLVPIVNTATVTLRYVAPAGTTGGVTVVQAGLLNNTLQIASQGTTLNQLDVSTVAGANAALASIDTALGTVNAGRASLGAVQNRFAAAVGTLQAAGANLAASRSRIVDADFAAEAARLSRSQVLQQAGAAMLVQANQAPANVLSLLKG